MLVEDAKAHTEPLTAHIEAVTSRIDDATAHTSPATANIEAVLAHTEAKCYSLW